MQRMILLLTFFSTIGLSTLSFSFFSQVHASEIEAPPTNAERMERRVVDRKTRTIENTQYKVEQKQVMMDENFGDLDL